MQAQTNAVRPKLFVLLALLSLVTVTFARQSAVQGLLAGIGAALLATWLVPRMLAQPFRELVDVAQRMAKGDLSVRPSAMTGDRLQLLGRALEQMAVTVTAAMNDLRAGRDLLSRILDRMEEGVLMLDADGRIRMTNPALGDMLLPRPALAARDNLDERRDTLDGIPSLLDVRGKTVLEVFRHAELAALLERARERGRVKAEIEIEGLKPRRLLVRTNRVDTAPKGYVVVFVDVTDVRRLESLRRDFVANVSHELLTPVAAVRAAAETMRVAGNGDSGSTERFLDIIERNTERLHALVKDLLELSRIESREFKLRWEDVDAPRLIDQILAMFKMRSEARGISLKTELAPSIKTLYTDRRALEMILSNLVDNAVKYCPEGASIVVRLAPREEKVHLQVEDTGPGIPSEHLSRLFERFYRVDPGRSRDSGGTGLGLSIVKHLAEALEGHAMVQSGVGQGSTFTISFPQRRASPLAQEPDVLTPAPSLAPRPEPNRQSATALLPQTDAQGSVKTVAATNPNDKPENPSVRKTSPGTVPKSLS